jgi:8-oxo-dGTP pyrophosphatase MutT (NUDIX family)
MDTEKFSGVLVKRDGKILLVQERRVEARGLWSLPLGHVEDNETVAEAAQREAGEETGLEVRIVKKIRTKIIPADEFRSSHKFSKGNIRMTIFEAKVTGKRYGAAELKHEWFTGKKLQEIDLRGAWMMAFFKD